MTPAQIVLDRIVGILLVLVCVGSAVYALVAVPMELPPVSWIIAREALFRGGTYGLVEAWAVTWFHLLAVGLAPFALGALVRSLLREKSAPALSEEVEARGRALRRRRVAWGLGVTALVLGFYAAVVFEPEVLEPVGFLGRIGLVIGPFAAYGGPMLLLDGLLAPTAQVIVVKSLQEAPSDSERRSLNAHWTLEAAQAADLAVGREVSIVATRVFDTVIAITPLTPYR